MYASDIKLGYNCSLFSYAPLVSFLISSPFSLPHRRLFSNLVVLMHCIPYICIGTLIQWSSVLSLSLLVLILGLSSKLHIHLSNRFYYPQIFWEHFQRFPAIMGTTESNQIYFFSSIHEWRRFYHWKNNQKNITMWIGQRTKSIVFFLSCCVPTSNYLYQSPKFTIRLSTFTVAA